MTPRINGHRTVQAALAVAAIAAMGACAAAPAPTSATSGGTAASTVARSGAIPVAAGPSTPPSRAKPAFPCLDPVVYTVDAWTIRPTLRTVCIAVGGVLRIAGVGPEGPIAIDQPDKVDCFYEGGVRECRLIETGTVRFAITNAQGTRQQTVVVAARASTPRLPDACLNAELVTRDVNETGWWRNAICIRLGVPLRFTNLESAGFTVNPSDAVDCWDSDDGRYCSPNRAATVRFTVTRPGVEDLTQTVVFVP